MQILIVEDDLILSHGMISKLQSLGYKKINSVQSGEAAIAYTKLHHPDLIFMDIDLEGALNGIQTTEIINNFRKHLPIVYLTKLQGKEIFQSIQQTDYVYFLPKPFNLAQLKAILDFITIAETVVPVDNLTLEGPIFLKKKDELDRINPDDILWVEGGRNTITICTKSSGKYVIVGTFAPFCKKINHPHLIRVHKSYLINLNKVEKIRGHQFIIDGHTIPFSKTYVPDINKLMLIVKTSK